MPDSPVPGLYEQILTAELRKLLDKVDHASITVASADKADSHLAVANHLRRILERVFRAMPDEERLTRQAELCNDLIAWLRDGHAREAVAGDEDSLIVPLSMLREVRALDRGAALATTTPQPLIPLSSADLLVNARGERSIGATIEREIHSADRIDLICAFIRWNGIRILQPALKAHRDAGRRLRIITTVYTGSTERRALDWLVEIGAEVKVSYDIQTTRLHAKAWLFERLSGFSTAFIGSSNLSHSAMLDGVEWNVRLAQASTPDLIQKFRAAFDGYWEDPDYETYIPARDAERFDRAVSSDARTTASALTVQPRYFQFDLQPYSFQREMLEQLTVERERHHRSRNLIVAATGTGKTLVAAFDYKRLRDQLKSPSLLFVAHRREILSQSLYAYRAVLKDGSFGELLVDGERPKEHRHVFASIQSLAEIDLHDIAADAFDVVVVDEFHHAKAPTYERLLRHLEPKILLGLTATPERTDGESVLEWFDGRIAVELRLWDALDKALLCPFQYFGIHDQTDLSQVQWRRRGYDVRQIENLYTGDQARVGLIVQAIQDKVANPLAMRALGFCVSVAHAEFMAREFTRRDLPSVAVSGSTSGDDRDAALRDLRDGKINVVFCVDIFNEGVDVPEIDTVLFLRPTESALVFLQQLGRGLRRAENKSCLTVLDFIGGSNRRFRFDLRFRALFGGHRSDIVKQIEDGFPRLPSGCTIQLDPVASRLVLDNVKGSLGSTFAGLVTELKAIAVDRRQRGDDPSAISLADFLRDADLELDDVYKSNGWTWSRMRRDAGLSTVPVGPHDQRVARAIPRLLHPDDPNRLALFRRALSDALSDAELDATTSTGRALMGLHFAVWGTGSEITSLRQSLERLRQHQDLTSELLEIIDLLEDRARHLPVALDAHMGWAHRIPLAVHSRASLDEILAAFGRLTFARQHRMREGRDFDPVTNSELCFVTLEKSEEQYSPTTMYRDYAISPSLFHWETQSTTSVASPTGRRYLEQRTNGTNVLLFARHRANDAGRTAAYTCLGAADYVSHQGSRPIAITWKLRIPMPDDFFREAKVAAG